MRNCFVAVALVAIMASFAAACPPVKAQAASTARVGVFAGIRDRMETNRLAAKARRSDTTIVKNSSTTITKNGASAASANDEANRLEARAARLRAAAPSGSSGANVESTISTKIGTQTRTDLDQPFPVPSP